MQTLTPKEFKVVALRECAPEIHLCDTPERAANYWRVAITSHPYFNPDVESFFVLMLNTRRRIKGHNLVSNGTLDTILVHPREVFRAPIISSSAAIILMHNHPSGDPSPSEADIKVTRDLIRAGQLLKIDVLDHVIMGEPHPAAMDNPLWSQAMAIVLNAVESSGHFRWFDSGDLRSLADLLKIVEVCYRTPNLKHWLPTHEVGILSAFKRSGGRYPKNLTVRLSADLVDKPIPKALLRSSGAHGSGLVASDHSKATCPAHTQFNKCQQCRQCWSRSVKSVIYPLK